tara:strand:+ start:675 stop:860 length:186 start_codon:yes stop_codon:yes gene_type:complete
MEKRFQAVNDTSKIMQWLNQRVNELKPTEKKEYYLNTEYAGRRVTIQVKIDAINPSTTKSS